MTKFIFVTGGVVSSLGKGIASASLAAVLESRGLNVTLLKLDPYINVDAGTMSPLQHGEVYVTEDGAETDLDLGHYERFVDTTMSKDNSYTTGRIYLNVIQQERRGGYLGSTVQVVPHIINEIKRCILKGADDAEVAMVEVGGTVGDIESQPFLEAVRQLRIELGVSNTLFIHLTLIPYMPASGEAKTKPTQHSVKELRSIGIQPDVLLCRTVSHQLSEAEREKIALFTNVDKSAIFSAVDVKHIYELPRRLHDQGIDGIVTKKLNLDVMPAVLSKWDAVVAALSNPEGEVEIAIIGKYHLPDSYKSLHEALVHAGIQTRTKVKWQYFDPEQFEKSKKLKRSWHNCLKGVDAILVPGGFGSKGIELKIDAIRYARENEVPYLGICLGMQLAVVEYARHQCGLANANSTEFASDTQHPVVALITEWTQQDGNVEVRDEGSDLGGTMRLGGQQCKLVEESRVRRLYGKDVVIERHRHRYEFNSTYKTQLEEAGMCFTGFSMDGRLMEIIELSTHPWFVACQFHPEFTSTPRAGHPLFSDFINAALKYQNIPKDQKSSTMRDNFSLLSSVQ